MDISMSLSQSLVIAALVGCELRCSAELYRKISSFGLRQRRSKKNCRNCNLVTVQRDLLVSNADDQNRHPTLSFEPQMRPQTIRHATASGDTL